MKLTFRIVILALIALSASHGSVVAHEGEEHGIPEPVVAVAGETLLAATGSGAAFDAVLKYRPFSMSEPVALTLYLVSLETNRPVADATVNASLSQGDSSTTMVFQPKAGGPVGAYSATVTPGSDAAMSWLFDVTAGSDYDLVAINGFKAEVSPTVKEARGPVPHSHEDHPTRLAILISVGTLLAIGAFAVGRFTSRKGASV